MSLEVATGLQLGRPYNVENTVKVLEDKEDKKEVILERNPLEVFNMAKSLCLQSGEKGNLQTYETSLSERGGYPASQMPAKPTEAPSDADSR